MRHVMPAAFLGFITLIVAMVGSAIPRMDLNGFGKLVVITLLAAAVLFGVSAWAWAVQRGENVSVIRTAFVDGGGRATIIARINLGSWILILLSMTTIVIGIQAGWLSQR